MMMIMMKSLLLPLFCLSVCNCDPVHLFTYIVRGRDILEMFTRQPDIPLPRSTSVTDLSDASLAFTLDVHRQLASGDSSKNSFFSPLSLMLALAVVSLGTEGETKSQLRKVLRVPEQVTDSEMHATYHYLVQALVSDPTTTLDLASRVYVDEEAKVKETFVKSSQTYYNSSVEQVNFRSDGEKTRQAINEWVSAQTNQKIPELLSASLPAKTLLLLVNAIYFKSKWLQQFDPSDTTPGFFLAGPDERLKVQMMATGGVYPVGRSEELAVTVITLPYTNNKFNMMILLPDPGVPLSDVERRLEPGVLRRVQTTLKELNITLLMPKFRLNEGNDLGPTLVSLGAENLFDGSRADLSGLVSTGGVDSLLHRAVIEVNEEGTEAAAASAILLTRDKNAAKKLLVINRPFLFAVVDSVTNFIVFWGRVVKPTS